MKNTGMFRKFGTFSLAGVLLASSFPASDLFAKAEMKAERFFSAEENTDSSEEKVNDVSLDNKMKISDLKSKKDLTGQMAAVEGTVTAVNVKGDADAMPVTYIQDDTGGIAAVGLDAKKGQRVRISGMVQDQKGSRSLLTQETVLINKKESDVAEARVSAADAASKEGFLVKVKGEITAKTADSITIDGRLTVYEDEPAKPLQEYKIGDSMTASGVIALDEKKNPRLIVSSPE